MKIFELGAFIDDHLKPGGLKLVEILKIYVLWLLIGVVFLVVWPVAPLIVQAAKRYKTEKDRETDLLQQIADKLDKVA